MASVPGIAELAELMHQNSNINQSGITSANVVLSIQRMPPRPHQNPRVSTHSTGSHTIKHDPLKYGSGESSGDPFTFHAQSQMAQSVYRESSHFHNVQQPGSLTSHQTPLQQKRKVVPLHNDNSEGNAASGPLITNGSKITMGHQFNHQIFNKTVRQGLETSNQGLYNEMNPFQLAALQPPPSAGGNPNMQLSGSIKMQGSQGINVINGGSLSKLGKRFSTNGSIVETGTDSKHANRMPQHFISMLPHQIDSGEYSDSPSKTFKGNQRPESVDLEPLSLHPHTPTKMQTSYNLAAEVLQQHSTSHIDQSCPATFKRMTKIQGAKVAMEPSKGTNLKQQQRHSMISQGSADSSAGVKNTLGSQKFDQSSLIIKPIKRITFTDKQASLSKGAYHQQSFQRESESEEPPQLPTESPDKALNFHLTKTQLQSPEPGSNHHQRYNSLQIRPASEVSDAAGPSQNLQLSRGALYQPENIVKSQDHGSTSPFRQMIQNEEDHEIVGRNIPFILRKHSQQSVHSLLMQGGQGISTSFNNGTRSPLNIELNGSPDAHLQRSQHDNADLPISIENQNVQQPRPMKQLHIRFGTSSASDTKDSDHGETFGPLAGEDPNLEVDDSIHFHQPSQQLQSTQQILLATGDNNQLIGILEEDSEDFDDEDEDEDDDDDLDGGQKGDYFQADTDMFNEEDEAKRDLGALDEVLEEDLLSDDGMGNAGDSGGEEFDRDQNTQSDDGGMAPAKPEKKKKKKKAKPDATGGPNTESSSPTKAGKKDLKEKKKSQQLQVQPQGNQILSPQIKITIQSKTGKVGKEQSAASPQVILQKQSTLKMTSNASNIQNTGINTPNVQQGKVKVDKILMSANKGTSGPDLNQTAKITKEQYVSIQQQINLANKEQKNKKKQKNVALLHSMPKNLEEEQQRFFDSECKVNPIFEYENHQLAQKYLSQFKEPNDEFMLIAKKILDSFLSTYESESNYLLTEGNILTQEETEKYFMDYLEALGVADQVVLNFCRNKVAPTSVTHDPKGGKSRINIGLPIEYRQGRIMGVLHHEIGTHFLRKYNEKFQVWYKKREKYELKNCIQTEEGFASINQLFEMCKDDSKKPFLFKAALNYYSAYMASKMSFVDLFNDLEKYIDNPKRRWKCVVRVKRGIADTGEPGGLYKDQVYLEGAIQILRERATIDFLGLYCGKLSLDDIKRPMIEKRIKKDGGLILPTFMSNMDEYNKSLEVIAKTNFIN